MDIDEYLESLENGEDNSSIEDALASLDNAGEDAEQTSEETGTESQDAGSDNETETETEEEDEQTSEESDESETEETTEEAKPEKRKQTPEENARYAEQRRQKQIEDRVKAELERIKQEDPAYKVAKQLSEMYGQPIEVIQKQLEEARIAKQAEQQGVSVDEVRSRERLSQLEQQNKRLQFEMWRTRVDSEADTVHKEFPMLSDDELKQAKFYLIEKLGPDVPFEDAVYALHGKKIIQAQREAAKNDALAEMSGRKKGAPPQQSGKPAPAAQALTPDELYIAKKMGLTPEEYQKYK